MMKNKKGGFYKPPLILFNCIRTIFTNTVGI